VDPDWLEFLKDTTVLVKEDFSLEKKVITVFIQVTGCAKVHQNLPSTSEIA
jgi:hypothetical protein